MALPKTRRPSPTEGELLFDYGLQHPAEKRLTPEARLQAWERQALGPPSSWERRALGAPSPGSAERQLGIVPPYAPRPAVPL